MMFARHGTRLSLATCLGIALIGGGCVLGARGVVEVVAAYSMSDIDSVRVDLPDTPIAVRGVPGQTSIELTGRWFSTGGTESVALDNTAEPRFDFAVEGRFARLTAVLPLEHRELLDLEVDEITLDPNRNIEVWTGLGNVTVTHMQGNVSVDIERGNIFIVGGAGGVGVRTQRGDAEIHSTGQIDAHTDRGELLLFQDGPGGNAVYASSDFGDIQVTLRSAQNLHLKIEAYRDIRVQTGSISTVTSESFERKVGNGTVEVFLDARVGSVTVLEDETGAD